MTDSDSAKERNRLVILRRDLERQINPMVAKEHGGSPFSDDERAELIRLRKEKAAVEAQIKRLGSGVRPRG